MSGARKPRVGVLGAGQLALMLAEAGQRIDVDVICAGQRGDCAGRVTPLVEVDLNDAAAVRAFADTMDVVTIESENIAVSVLDGLRIAPNPQAIAIAQDRLKEKDFFNACGIETAPYAAVSGEDEMRDAVRRLGVPGILKSRRMGYDGKGQVRLRKVEDAGSAWRALQLTEPVVECVYEGMVEFSEEVSLIAARSSSGEMVFYPLTMNVHREGVLRKSVAPYVDARLQETAETHLRTLMERMEYVGVLAVEYFVVDGRLVANEMAPRVHNSGHWTIEGAATSQFENHLRAVLGMPLGRTDATPTVMLNCIGTMPPEDATAGVAGLLRHDYGKDPRAGRKVGHLTFPGVETPATRAWEERLK